MSHPLQTKVASISRRADRLVSAHAASRLLAITLGSVVLLAGSDYLFRYRDRGLRVICTAALIAAVGWAVYRFLIPLLHSRQDDLATARRIERRFPLLGQRLSSALQFLCEDEDDPKAGSSALRRAVIIEAAAQVEPLELGDVLDRRPIWRALAVATAVCVAAVLAWRADPAAARMGTMRLLNPLSDVAWPRETQLEFLTPITQVAMGESFQVTLVNRNGSLPRDVQIHFRQRADGRSLTQDGLPQDGLTGAGGKMIVRRENVREAFEYRASGGDDLAMEWIAVAVVEPPQADVPRISIIPPSYSGWPSRVSKASIRALRGSRVELQAVVNRPLRSAAVLLEGGRRIEAAISPDGMSFSVASDQSEPWVIAEDRAYWFELVDREDSSLIGGSLSKWEIRPVTDNRPTVDLQLPSAANVYVTREAIVPLRAVVQDDLAIRDVALVFTLSDPSDEQELGSDPPQQSISLYQGPAAAKRQANKDATGEMLTLGHSWELAKFDLRPGMQIEYRATANDYQPASGESPLRRLLIITTAQLESRIADRQSAIVAELARVLRIERQSRAHLSSLEIQLKQIGHLNKEDVDSLQAARLAQQQATRILAAEGAGLVFQIEAMLDELRTNRINSPETTGRLTTLAAEIKSLADGPLPRIEHQLDQALSGAQAQLDQPPKTHTPQAEKQVATAVGAAGEEQDRVITSLGSMLSEWSQWDNFRRLVRDLTELLRDQQELRRSAAVLGSDPKVIGRRTDELTLQQQADLLKLGHRQLALSRRLDATETRMEQLIETLRGEETAPVGMIADALDLSRTRATSGHMRQSARGIEENRIGQARSIQQQVLVHLQEILDVLLSRREKNLARRIDKLQQAEKDLDEIQRKQQALVKNIGEAGQASSRGKRQREIAAETESLTRRVRRLDARRAAKKLGNATGGMNRAAESKDDNSGQQQKQIAKDLEDAKRQLAQRRRESQADLMREQMAQLAEAVTGLIKRQNSLITQTERLETDRNTTPQAVWPERVDSLSGKQIAIGSDLHHAAESLTSSAVFELALQNTSGDIARAVELLRENETGVKTVKAQQRALGHMTRIVEALKSKPPDDTQPPDDAADPDAGDRPQADQGKITMVEELALLLAMQRDVNRRTMAIEQSRAKTGELTERQKIELDRLSEEQGSLADLFRQLTEQPEVKVEDDDR